MSHCADETYDVYHEKFPRSRVDRPCGACKETIKKGQFYASVRVVYDGKAETIVRCMRCQRIHEHLRTLGRENEMWPDERLACGLKYEDEWGALPDAIAALAFALPGETERDDEEWLRKKAIEQMKRDGFLRFELRPFQYPNGSAFKKLFVIGDTFEWFVSAIWSDDPYVRARAWLAGGFASRGKPMNVPEGEIRIDAA